MSLDNTSTFLRVAETGKKTVGRSELHQKMPIRDDRRPDPWSQESPRQEMASGAKDSAFRQTPTPAVAATRRRRNGAEGVSCCRREGWVLVRKGAQPMEECRVDGWPERGAAFIIGTGEEGPKGVPLEEHASPKVAETGRSGAAAVSSNGIRGSDDLSTRGPKTPPELDILEVGEELRIETAKSVPIPASDGHVAATGKGQELSHRRWFNGVDRPTLTDLKRMDVEGHAATDKIVPSTIPGRQPTGGGRGLRVILQDLEVSLDKTWFGCRIIIEQNEDLTCRGFGAQIDSPGKTKVDLRPYDLEPGPTSRGGLAASIERRVVNQHHLTALALGCVRQ